MDLIQAVVYGLVQGLTEFLPVSSTGHVLIVSQLFGWEKPSAGFSAVIQLGTLLAVLIYFWRDIWTAVGAWFRSIFDSRRRQTPEARLGWAVFVGTIPVAVAGLLFEDKIDSALRSTTIVASMLIGIALVMWLAEKMSRKLRELGAISVADGAIVGLWQALALIPGASRSGCTIAGSLFLGMDRPTAARFSFLLSVPSVLASGLYKLYKEREGLFVHGSTTTVVATVVAFVSGVAAIAFLMRYLQRNSTGVFIGYRIVLGLVLFALLADGMIS